MTDLWSRYAAAEALLAHKTRGLTVGGAPIAIFTGDGDTFLHPGPDGLMHVDPVSRSIAPAAPAATAQTHPGASVSPDGRWAVSLDDGNLVLREQATGEERRLTTDADSNVSYASPPDVTSLRVRLEPLGRSWPPLVRWAPDSRFFVTQRLDQTGVSVVDVVEAAPADGGRPRHVSWRYPFPGDEALPRCELLVVDVADAKMTVAATGPLETPFTTPLMGPGYSWWAPTGDTFYVLHGNRDQTMVRLYAVDPRTGAAHVVVQESGTTPVFLGAMVSPTVRVLSTGEVVWWSERSGWGHLYLYDAQGEGIRQLTAGAWVVREVVAIDEQARTAVVTGSGRESGLDPYARQLYRLDLDTAELHRISDDRLDHEALGTPSGRFFLDSASALDMPGRCVVRDHEGTEVLDLGSGDITALLAAGYELPERFVVKAADGETDIYGVLYRPHGLDPAGSYPVLEDTYFNPRIAMAGIRCIGSGGMSGLQALAPSFAALGFAVVVIDSRGTGLRSRAFRESSLGLGFDDGLADRAAALRQLGAIHPWLDLSRVGVYGMSAGGYAATRALLRHPDVYRAAVAGSGSHDDRLAFVPWAEQVRGPFATTDWAALSNTSLVDRLEGNLLLIHGDVDDVALPAVTLRLVEAFMVADKDVDLLYVPGGDHGVFVNDAHVVRRVWDYFIRHVAGETPCGYRLAPFPDDGGVDQLLAAFSS